MFRKAFLFLTVSIDEVLNTGTKGFYACPHSYFGDHENESILQAGTQFRITKVEAPDYGTCYVDLEVIGYVQHPQL